MPSASLLFDTSAPEDNEALLCESCERLGMRLRRQEWDVDIQEELTSFHDTYHRLRSCAIQRQCKICQLFRRALLLELETTLDVVALEEPDSKVHAHWDQFAPVQCRLKSTKGCARIELSLGHVNSCKLEAGILVKGTAQDHHCHELTHIPSSMRYQASREWLRSCVGGHALCKNLRFSTQNPTWLLRLLPQDETGIKKAQLVHCMPSSPLLPYVALSHCWGDRSSLRLSSNDMSGWKRIRKAQTVSEENREKVPNLMQRLTPFERSVFPKTMQHAADICDGLGMEYIWIDAVCIPDRGRARDWDEWATRMHEVYGNACFTLVASCTTNDLDPLIIPGYAWEYPSDRENLAGYQLSVVERPLNKVQLQPPLSEQGWCLQEERFSPRVLYWGAQRCYWSCAESQHVEHQRPTGGVPMQQQQQQQQLQEGSNLWSSPQAFIKACRSGDPARIQTEWHDVVASYTRRHLWPENLPMNRFLAIAGLATRYLFSNGFSLNDEYLAGLWRKSFGADLTWQVLSSANATSSLRKIVDPETGIVTHMPTWSWCSLPLRTKLIPHREPQLFSTVEVLEVKSVYDARVHLDDRHETHLDDVLSSYEKARRLVDRGADVKRVRVRARLRKLLSVPTTEPCSWSDVMQTDQFVTEDPTASAIATNEQGKFVYYEPYLQEIFGQLDYSEKDTATCLGTIKNLYCMECGPQAMILLLQDDTQHDLYTRAGVSRGHRKNFFDGCRAERIWLA